MPSNVIRNTPAVALEVDMRPYAGVNVFDRGAVNYTLSASAGLFRDLLAFLHGFGVESATAFNTELAANWTASGAAGTIVAGIDADDFFYLESDTDDFAVTAGAQNTPFGFDLLGHALVGGVAPFRRTATEPWERGVVLNKSLIVDPTGAPLLFATITTNYRAQSLPVELRIRGSVGDADDVWNGLTLEDIDAAGSRWYVDATGRVVNVIPSAGTALTWVDLDFARELGFRGDETATTSGGLKILVATDPAPSFLAPTRQLIACDDTTDTAGDASRMQDGSWASVHQAAYEGWRVVLRVDGRVGSTEDLERHLVRWLRRARLGRPMTLYPMWGDLDSSASSRGSVETRRHRDITEAPYTGGSVVGYDLLYTAEDSVRAVNARTGGRLLGVRHGSDGAARQTDYGGRELAQYQDMTLIIGRDPLT